MKRILIAIAFILPLATFAFESGNEASDTTQAKPKHWTAKSNLNLTMEQTQISNWAAGGNSNMTYGALFKGFYNYQSGKHKVDNTVELSYGRTRQHLYGDNIWADSNKWRKNEDKIELNSIYGYQAFKSWNYSGLLNLKSQFEPAYRDPDNKLNMYSAFFSPATLTSSLGMEYKKTGFSTLFSFLTGKTTFVADKELRTPSLGYVAEEGDMFKFSLGSYIKIFYQKDIMKNVNLLAKLDFFWDYEKPILDTDINGEVFINMKFSKYLSAFISVQAAIDKDFNDKIQFKERFGIAIPLTF